MKTCPVCATENPEESSWCAACERPFDGSEAATAHATRREVPRRPRAVADSSSSLHGRFLPGTKIADRYRIVSLAGRGGMGEVYRADDLKLGHPVALKFLPRDVTEGSRGFQYFLSEVRLSRQIAHPNVCRVYDIDEVDGQQFLSMEYIDGEDLKGLLRRIGRLPKDKGTQIAQQLCAGLAAAHEKGVLHRDLKPANIMIDGRGQARITDFGLARLADGAAGTVDFAGTPAYMAPEQLARGETTIQSDLYSLGLILYEIFTGQPVHRSSSLDEVMRAHEDSAPSPSNLVADMDPAVERVILRCLEKEPARRPKSARAVAAALPGGDPLAAALAAGETPSPEMVAAAGEQGAIDRGLGLVCLAGVAVGLVLVCWLAQRTYLVNQVGLDRHPESLADSARRMVERFGYTNHTASAAHGFRTEARDIIRFWYRQRPLPPLANDFWNDWGELSFARINHVNPSWDVAGEFGFELNAAGQLIRFRAIPRFEPSRPPAQGKPDWHHWFPAEFTGFDLKSLEPIQEWSIPAPDAYDHAQVWKSGATNNSFYVHAASHAGRPVYFNVLTPAEFEGLAPSRAMWLNWIGSDESTNRQRGASLYLSIVLIVWIGAAVLAWRNFRLGRIDRKGAFRVAFVLFCAAMLNWLFRASHIAGGYEVAVLQIGVAQGLWRAAIFWLYYSALEPHTRRLWPQFLISWTRLLEGRWRDPLVGQNLLLGVLAGVVGTVLAQFGVLAPTWFGLAPQPGIVSHPLTLDGPSALVGNLLYLIISAASDPLFSLVLLLFLRLVLRRILLVACAYVAIMTTTFTLFSQAHPVVGWFVVGAWMSLCLWVYLRLGFLAGIVMLLTRAALLSFPLTTDWSAWYAGNGFAAVAFVLALASFGFYTSQAGRPIFQEAPFLRTAH